MSVSGHLGELRKRVIVCIAVYIVAFLICLRFAGRLVTMFTDMGTGYGYRYVYIAPQELLMVYFSIALLGALVIDLPVIFYQLYCFSAPGLLKREQRAFQLAVFFGSLSFLVGIAFAYKISVPFMLYFLISFTREVAVTASISIQEFVNFLLTVFLIFGCIFELPLLSVILAMLGILNSEILKRGRKVVIVLIFFIAAIVTPPDIASQIITAIPMCLLYELSIFLAKIFYRKRESSEEDEEDKDRDRLDGGSADHESVIGENKDADGA